MEHLGSRIQYARKRAGLTQEGLAEKVRRDWRTLARYEQGVKLPPLDVLEKIAREVGVRLPWLVEDAPPPAEPGSIPRTRRKSRPGREARGRIRPQRRSPVVERSQPVPLFQDVPAGDLSEALQLVDDAIEVPARWLHGAEVFCMRVRGRSMEPDLHDGDFIAVRRQPRADSGEMVVAWAPGFAETGDYTVKQYRVVDGRPRLRCINRAIPDPPLDLDFRIDGKVVGLIRAF